MCKPGEPCPGAETATDGKEDSYSRFVKGLEELTERSKEGVLATSPEIAPLITAIQAFFEESRKTRHPAEVAQRFTEIAASSVGALLSIRRGAEELAVAALVADFEDTLGRALGMKALLQDVGDGLRGRRKRG